MFLDLFYGLRKEGVPVSLQEWQEFGVGVPGSEDFVKASVSYLLPATFILAPIFTLPKP